VGEVLRAYDASSGQGLWDSPVAGGLFSSSRAVSDGVIYASADDGTVYAFALP
jgi:outer membrane protein assembly factor BamB